jgi:hypothetical protein
LDFQKQLCRGQVGRIEIVLAGYLDQGERLAAGVGEGSS